MTCPCCIEVPTLQSVYDSETRDYGDGDEERDLIREAMALTGSVYGDYEDTVEARIWNDYRYRMMGTCDTDMFVRILADRLTAEALTTVMQIEAVNEAVESGYVTAPGKIVISGEHTDTLARTREDMPDNFSANFAYPSDKSEDKNTYGQHTVSELGVNGTVAEDLKRSMEAYKDPLDDLMRAISVCWLNRW